MSQETQTPHVKPVKLLQQEFSDQLEVTDTDLELESKKTLKLFNKVQLYYGSVSEQLFNTQSELDKMTLKRYKFYSGKASVDEYRKETEKLTHALTKVEIDQYLKADEKLIAIRQRLNDIELCVKYLEELKKVISNRQYIIKTILDYRNIQTIR